MSDLAYHEIKSEHVRLFGLKSWEKRHRKGRLDCPCRGCLESRGPVADRTNWAGYTLRELQGAS